MKTLSWLAIFGILVSGPSGILLSQEGQIDLPSVGESSVVIVNRANIPISYSIRPKDGDWSNYNIAPGSNMKISCNDCTTSLFEINIKTGNGEINYDLESGERFMIMWNSAKSLWDVYRANQ